MSLDSLLVSKLTLGTFLMKLSLGDRILWFEEDFFLLGDDDFLEEVFATSFFNLFTKHFVKAVEKSVIFLNFFEPIACSNYSST